MRVLSRITAALIGLSILPAWAEGEIKLLKVQTTEAHYPAYRHAGRVEALVADLGYNKRIGLYLKKTDGSWFELPLTYKHAANAGKEVWVADFNSATPGIIFAAEPFEFALKYTVNGQTYWDNNNGNNYRYNKNTGTVLFGTPVYDGDFRAEYNSGANLSTYSGWITVRNLGPTKDVAVVYSTDGWDTVKTAKAVYNSNFWEIQYINLPNPNAYGFEEWRYSLNVGSAPQVDYAIRYTVNGQTYWDNNYGRNYHVRLTQ